MALPVQTGLSWADLQQFPEEQGLRHEIIAGALYVTPAPAFRHQRVVVRLAARLLAYVEEHGGDLAVGPNVYFSDDTVVQPDVVLVRGEHTDRVERLFVRGAPDLVVELSSASTRSHDLGAKRALYEREAVPEYWFVDLEIDRVELYRRAPGGSGYASPVLLSRGDQLTSPLLPGLRIDVDDALGPAEPAGDP